MAREEEELFTERSKEREERTLMWKQVRGDTHTLTHTEFTHTQVHAHSHTVITYSRCTHTRNPILFVPCPPRSRLRITHSHRLRA